MEKKGQHKYRVILFFIITIFFCLKLNEYYIALVPRMILISYNVLQGLVTNAIA